MDDFFLSAHHIVKRFANHTALNDVSIDVPRGKFSVCWALTAQARQRSSASSTASPPPTAARSSSTAIPSLPTMWHASAICLKNAASTRK